LLYPLTGLPASSAQAVRRPSLAVKIDNVDGAWPQAGLNRADIVFDILVEGGLTRLMAVYQSNSSPLVGPIRSARPVDAFLTRLLRGGFLAFSGASPGEMRPVRKHSHAVLIYDDKDSAPFRRTSDHADPHNLFSSTARLRSAFHRVAPHAPGPPPMFTHDPKAPFGPRTHKAMVPYPAASAGWAWTGHGYVRSQDGHPDLLMNHTRVSADNVVIMSVKIVGTGIFESNGAEDPLPVTTGSGRLWVLRNGVRVTGTWQRADISTPLHLYDPHHHRIPLEPGRTWVELMPASGTPSFGH
jgi:hypothetical protein